MISLANVRLSFTRPRLFLVFLLSPRRGARSQGLLKMTFSFVDVALGHLHPSLDVAWATAGLGLAAPGGRALRGTRLAGHGAQTEVWHWPFAEAGRRVGAPSGAVLPPGLGLPTFSLDFPRPGPAVWAVGASLRLSGLLIPTPCSHGLLCTRPHPCPAGGCSCCHLLF